MPEDIEELMTKVSLLEIKARDEVRFLDWNITARTNTPHIRTFTEERELTVLIAVDISSSGKYASGNQSKRALAAEIAAVLAFSAKQNGDKVGLLLFSGSTELYLPPSKGTKHTLRIIREILAFEQSTVRLSYSCSPILSIMIFIKN